MYVLFIYSSYSYFNMLYMSCYSDIKLVYDIFTVNPRETSSNCPKTDDMQPIYIKSEKKQKSLTLKKLEPANINVGLQLTIFNNVILTLQLHLILSINCWIYKASDN